ncbi:HNH endonuclease [Croceimicrobium hydrocarbonivorans]|uniref:HNH endonuclease n=1 Tax=Croceimicrobium hydrocarbonivorans TaxID=2761580 RepID=A0A7H0VHE8_9FLAO|nr:HNH endonuclease [Croceimicrobium hydrocarbonivorans]QNR25146.1 HNH endonuclease [Croceimicrobium hydrocarbonivorans]
MANRWKIPKDVEELVKKRDTKCIYCGVLFSSENNSRKDSPSWEHIINDIRINDTDNIARCCISCNSSKGSKSIQDWLRSDYCRKKGINSHTVSAVVNLVLKKAQKTNKN